VVCSFDFEYMRFYLISSHQIIEDEKEKKKISSLTELNWENVVKTDENKHSIYDGRKKKIISALAPLYVKYNNITTALSS
jgi:hypothetical protein